jgi:hypothetical protein
VRLPLGNTAEGDVEGSSPPRYPQRRLLKPPGGGAPVGAAEGNAYRFPIVEGPGPGSPLRVTAHSLNLVAVARFRASGIWGPASPAHLPRHGERRAPARSAGEHRYGKDQGDLQGRCGTGGHTRPVPAGDGAAQEHVRVAKAGPRIPGVWPSTAVRYDERSTVVTFAEAPLDDVGRAAIRDAILEELAQTAEEMRAELRGSANGWWTVNLTRTRDRVSQAGVVSARTEQPGILRKLTRSLMASLSRQRG